MKQVRNFWLFAVMLLITACAQMGVEPAKTFNDRVAVGVSSATASLQTITVLVDAGKLAPDEGIQMIEGVQNVRVALSAVRALWKTDPLAAEDRLGTLMVLLQQLDIYLKGKTNGKV